MKAAETGRSGDKEDPSHVPAVGPIAVRRRTFQVSMRDLLLVVISAGVTLGVARHAKFGTWWQRDYTLYGLLLIPIALYLAGRLLAEMGEVIGHSLYLSVDSKASCAVSRISMLVWRAVAVALLSGFVLHESWLLMFAEEANRLLGVRQEARSGALTVGGTLLMCGLVAGMKPRPLRPVLLQPQTKHRQIVGWILLAAVLMVAAVHVTFVPYLVLIAIEAVSLATRHWEGNGPGSLVRLSCSKLPASAAFFACLMSSIWLAYDLRRPDSANADTHARAWWVLSFRALSLLAPVAAAAYLVFVTLPWLNKQLSDGLWLAIGPVECAMVVTGFAVLGGGITAQAIARGHALDTVQAVPLLKQATWFERIDATRAGLQVVLALVSCTIIAVAGIASFPNAAAQFLSPHLLDVASMLL